MKLLEALLTPGSGNPWYVNAIIAAFFILIYIPVKLCLGLADMMK